MKLRSSYLKHDEYVELGRRGLKLWGYSPKGKFVCRLHVNAAGVAMYAGKTGNKTLANVTWEGLVRKLSAK
jgi:hypothetical protein